jgi:AraC-like DNA-binding protein
VLINFRGDFISDWLPVREINIFDCFQHACNAVKLGTNEQIHVEDLLFGMITEYTKRSFGFELYLKTLLIELLLLLNRHIRQNPSEEFDPHDSQHKRILEIVNYINNNYSEPLTLERLSKIFFLNPGYLSRIFKQVTGFNFVKYVNHVRIKESVKLLKETRLSITHIAGKTGFESPTHFGRVFRAITGQSPESYRKGKSS